eukprot:EC719233.1.p1 GENE.EC719233.1~~EC719233.1.p1  ORF type:complete len:116 (+),score=37.04 EC719233.1:31-378(+)
MFLRATASHLRNLAAASARPQVLRAWYGAAAQALSEDVVKQRVFNVLTNFQGVDPQKVKDTAHFQKDLGLDSLTVVELVMAIEEEFGIEMSDDDADRILTAADAIKYISKHPHAM